MKKILIPALLLLSGCAVLGPGRPDIAITNLKFGDAQFVPLDLGFKEVKVTREADVIPFLPAKPGQQPYQFGYSFDYSSSVRRPRFTLVITMPSKPANLRMELADAPKRQKPGKPYVVRQTRRLAHQRATSGSLFGFSQGDPLGEWRFDFYLENQLLKTATVTVVAP